MFAASLHSPALLPVAASPVGDAVRTVTGGGGVTPMANQGFVPVGAAAGAAASAGSAAPATSAAPAAGANTTAGAAAGSPAAQGDGSIDAAQGLAAVAKVFGDEYGDPIISADGTVFLPKSSPSSKNGQFALSYVKVGKIDKTTGKLTFDPAFLALIKEKQASANERKLVKVGEDYTWQTFATGEDGKTTAEVVKATDAEVQAYQQQQAQAAAKQAAQDKLTNNADWQGKIGQVSSALGIFGSAGSVVQGLSQGPNQLSGKPGAGWISGWILAQRLNGRAEGKLLPQFLQTGWVATAMEWGLQAYGMLDMGQDIRNVVNFAKHKVETPPLVNPNALQNLIKAGEDPAMAKAMVQLGTDLRTPVAAYGGQPLMQSLTGTGNTALINNQLNAAQLVPTDTLNKAFNATDPITDPLLKARGAVDGGITKGLGMLKGLVQPAMIGATALGAVSSVINVKNIVAKQGAAALIDTKQGRGALLGAISSVAFLGVYLAPMILPQLGVIGAAATAALSGINIISNVVGGVQLLNSYGLFGEEGFLNHDAVRAAFLIPPLTPIGGLAFLMKARKKQQDAKAAKLEAAQQVAGKQLRAQAENNKLQLQQAGKITGSTQNADGTITVATSVPTDMAKLAAQLAGAGVVPAAAGAAAAPKA